MLSKFLCAFWAASSIAMGNDFIVTLKMDEEQQQRSKSSDEGYKEVFSELRQPLSEERLQELEIAAGVKFVDFSKSSMYGAGRLLRTDQDFSRDEVKKLVTDIETLPWVREVCLSPKSPIPGHFESLLNAKPIPCDKGEAVIQEQTEEIVRYSC